MHSFKLPRSAGLVGPCLLALVWGCGATSGNDLSGSQLQNAGGALSAGGSTAGTADSGGSLVSAGTATGGANTGSTDFPCDVQQLLATKCQLCHKVNPPGALLTSADFLKPSVTDASRTVGQVAIERLQATTGLRMPPAPLAAATPAEIATLSAWIQGGAMPAACGQTVPVAPDPYATPVVCTSMKQWTGGNHDSPLMRPGGACISCHQKGGEGPLFAVSGTVFPSAHEPDDCDGVSGTSGAQVVVTEANGTAHTLAVNAAGNFYLQSRTFTYPYQAKVVYQGRERVMVEAQTSGDCNDCHTQDGSQNAPGRVFLP